MKHVDLSQISTKYSIIYADPPWNGLGWNTNKNGLNCPARQYNLMTLDEIKSLPVKNITADTCALFLWATMPNLPSAIEVISAWGFNYATCAFTWVKRNKKKDGYFFGLGNYTRANAELCLLGTKGKCQKMRQSRKVFSICDARLTKHSAKPPEIRDRIIELFGDLPRIELFAREQVDKWDCWGAEC